MRAAARDAAYPVPIPAHTVVEYKGGKSMKSSSITFATEK